MKRDTDSGRSAAVSAAVTGAPRSRTEEEHGQDARATAGGTPALPRVPAPRHWPLWVAGLLVVIVAGLVMAWVARRRVASPLELKQRQLTSNSSESPVSTAAISPDGKYLAYVDASGINLRLVETGEARALPAPQGAQVAGLAWFPDGTRLLATAKGRQPSLASLWSISILGGLPRKLRDDASGASPSVDGSQIAFVSAPTEISGGLTLGKEVWLMGASGEDARRIITVPQGEYFVGAWLFRTGSGLGAGESIIARPTGISRWSLLT
jgi:hypothetical protein